MLLEHNILPIYTIPVTHWYYTNNAYKFTFHHIDLQKEKKNFKNKNIQLQNTRFWLLHFYI